MLTEEVACQIGSSQPGKYCCYSNLHTSRSISLSCTTIQQQQNTQHSRARKKKKTCEYLGRTPQSQKRLVPGANTFHNNSARHPNWYKTSELLDDWFWLPEMKRYQLRPFSLQQHVAVPANWISLRTLIVLACCNSNNNLRIVVKDCI